MKELLTSLWPELPYPGTVPWAVEKEKLGILVVRAGYNAGCIETIFNTKDPEKRKNGWILKNGTNSIYFINIRNAGNSSEFTSISGYAMGRVLVEEVPNYDTIIGVDMAGVPLVSAIATATYLLTQGEVKVKWGYTRPLPGEKIRSVDGARKTLEALKQEKITLGEWGAHNLVEGEILDGYNLVIGDDMVTDLGTKLIAREVIKYEIERLGVKDVKYNEILVGMDREQGADEAAKKEGMNLYSVVPMRTKGFTWLADAMPPEQYRYINAFIKDPSPFQDIGRDPETDRNKGKSPPLMQEALEFAARIV